MMLRWLASIPDTLRRARVPILWMAATHLVGVLVGAAMVHGGNAFALHQRDAIVGRALQHDPASVALARGLPLRAGLIDFAGNLGAGVSSTVLGLAVVLPYPMAAWRGWIGGIVSVDGRHRSRLGPPRERWYYLTVILLQLVPYSLAGGAGVRLGLDYLRRDPGAPRWLGLPAAGVRDVLRIYTLIVPLVLVASLVEFLAR